MKVLVCGGRDFTDRGHLNHVLNVIHCKTPITLLIQGQARGADRLAAEWARLHRVQCPKKWAADWENTEGRPSTRTSWVWKKGRWYDARAGHERNRRMLEEAQPDLVVAFDGGSGTADMVKRARAAGIPVQDASWDKQWSVDVLR